ncbi:MAG: hypothetical protein IKY44_01400 [Clostridia bacterium]|nr:hypothetical protein [Clostridia bacterium]
MIEKMDIGTINLPNRKNILAIFEGEVYGKIPPSPQKIDASLNEVEGLERIEGGTLYEVDLTCQLDEKTDFSFRFNLLLPHKKGKNKTVVFLNFRPDIPDKYYPVSEIINRGWACASLDYQRITSDTNSADGLAKIYAPNGEIGKLSLWAWAAMRMMDYLETRDDIDLANIGVVGHSRLGKTALWTAANDERFRFVHSNDSGTAGAALYKYKNERSESIKDIYERFPYWFVEPFKAYIDMEQSMPFDQDDLLKCVAPRIVSIGSANEDAWANPYAEMLCAKEASLAWESMGEKGLVNIPQKAELGVNYHDGKVGYYVREGKHYFSLGDWCRFLSFFDKNLQK